MALGESTRFMRLDDNDPAVLVDIAGAAVEMGSFAMTRETTEKTYYSNAGGYKSHSGGARDLGEGALTLEFDKASGHHLSLRADFDSDVPRQYGFQWATEAKDQLLMMGLVTGYEITQDTGTEVTVAVKFKWSGAPTWGAWT